MVLDNFMAWLLFPCHRQQSRRWPIAPTDALELCAVLFSSIASGDQSLDLSAPELQSLNAANCKSLAALSCEAPRLVRLSLSLCRRLRDAGLELACPALRDVNVNQCTALTSAGTPPLNAS